MAQPTEIHKKKRYENTKPSISVKNRV